MSKNLETSAFDQVGYSHNVREDDIEFHVWVREPSALRTHSFLVNPQQLVFLPRIHFDFITPQKKTQKTVEDMENSELAVDRV